MGILNFLRVWGDGYPGAGRGAALRRAEGASGDEGPARENVLIFHEDGAFRAKPCDAQRSTAARREAAKRWSPLSRLREIDSEA